MNTAGNEKIQDRTRILSRYKDIKTAVAEGGLARYQDISLSEALVLGLYNQGVRTYVGILGHGSTDIGNVLAHYEEAGLVRFFNVRHETEAAHCVSMLKWHYGETAALVTSIGPGALHAFAGSLVSASNGLGVYHIYGDETTHDEGPNMQQIPKPDQAGFLDLVKSMGRGYLLHTPEAVFAGLRKGASTVFNPVNPGPFFLLMPINTQPAIIHDCNLLELPDKPRFPRLATEDPAVFERAARLVDEAAGITIKLGGGSSGCGEAVRELAELIDAVVVSGAKMSGVVPYSWRRFMSVGGSKGSSCGNYAMNQADLVILVGARAVCQWDCSGTAWKNAKHVVNFNTDPFDGNHYNNSLIILGDAEANLRKWSALLASKGFPRRKGDSAWLVQNEKNKKEWQAFKKMRYDQPRLFDPVWNREVLTQPGAIKTAFDFAVEKKAARYFDAGDVQANGFQIAEDEVEGLTFSDTGASYMGFAASALLAGAAASKPVYAFAFSGDGSFTMNPQILFDGVEHGVKGCVLIFDNRSMAAISGLQKAQYSREYKTRDAVHTDYMALAASVQGVNALFGGFTPEELLDALNKAYAYDGLSVIHVPVYAGDHELGGLGVFGSWNVGNWCDQVQKEHHRIGL